MKKTFNRFFGILIKKKVKRYWICNECSDRYNCNIYGIKDEFVFVTCNNCFKDVLKNAKQEIDW